MDLKEESILGESIYKHWYYLAKGQAMKVFIGPSKVDEVLDVGAGSGIFSKQLLDAGIAQSAVCVDPNYDEEREERYNGKLVKFVRGQNKTTQNLILIMDVLEHVEDDLALLKSYVDSMDEGGRVFITVPAFQFLWSGHDVFLEHYRRYTLSEVESLVKQAGLTPVKSRYFFGILFPLIAIVRGIGFIRSKRENFQAKSDLKNYPEIINKLLILIHLLERKTLFRFNRLFGLSVFCICEKGKEA